MNNHIKIIRKSDLSDKIKWDTFQDVAMSVLLYKYTTWWLTKRLENLNGNYTRMMRVLEKSLKYHLNQQLLCDRLAIQPDKKNKVWRPLLEKQRGTHKQQAPVDSNARVQECWSIS